LECRRTRLKQRSFRIPMGAGGQFLVFYRHEFLRVRENVNGNAS
jgi:hypothetical protein